MEFGGGRETVRGEGIGGQQYLIISRGPGAVGRLSNSSTATFYQI